MPDTLPARHMDAWELTRRLAVRGYVQAAAPEAGGTVTASSANSYPLKHPVGPAAPATPWYMHLADVDHRFHYLAFDFDGKVAGISTPELVELAADECDSLSRLLEHLAIAHVVCESSGSGGRHIWVALAAGVAPATVHLLSAMAKSNYRQLDHGMLRNPKDGGVRPPLSPHRDGSSSRILRGDLGVLTTPTTTLEQVQQLTRELERRQPAETASQSVPNGPAVPSHKVHRELTAWGAAHMATAGGGDNPSWTGFMCLLAAASAGWTLSDVVRAAATAPGMEHYRTKNSGAGGRKRRTTAESQKRLEQQWEKAQRIHALRAFTPTRRPQRDLAELNSLVSAVSAVLTSYRVSPGRWGATLGRVSERSVLSSLAYLTLATGKREVAASVRTLALMASIGASTAADALLRLEAAGLATRTRNTSGVNAAEWSLGQHFSTASDRTRTHHRNNTSPPAELFAERRQLLAVLEGDLAAKRHDVFTYQGLGHYAGLVYSRLQLAAGASLEELAGSLGMTRRHVTTALSRLRKHQLVVRAQDGWAAAKRDLRSRAAQTLGVLGILSARARRFDVDRQLWAWWQAEYTTMATPPRMRPRRPHVSSRVVFGEESPGERLWPRYPRDTNGQASHRQAREHVEAGHLSPTSRIRLMAA